MSAVNLDSKSATLKLPEEGKRIRSDSTAAAVTAAATKSGYKKSANSPPLSAVTLKAKAASDAERFKKLAGVLALQKVVQTLAGNLTIGVRAEAHAAVIQSGTASTFTECTNGFLMKTKHEGDQQIYYFHFEKEAGDSVRVKIFNEKLVEHNWNPSAANSALQFSGFPLAEAELKGNQVYQNLVSITTGNHQYKLAK